MASYVVKVKVPGWKVWEYLTIHKTTTPERTGSCVMSERKAGKLAGWARDEGLQARTIRAGR